MFEALAARCLAKFIDRWPWETTGDWKYTYAVPVVRAVLRGPERERALKRLNGEPGRAPPSKRAARWAFMLYQLFYGHWPQRAWWEAERLELMVYHADR